VKGVIFAGRSGETEEITIASDSAGTSGDRMIVYVNGRIADLDWRL
jgi:hypothetical protein